MQMSSPNHWCLHSITNSQSSPEDMSIDFEVGLPKMWRGIDSICIVIDEFSKMAYFIPCKKTMNLSYVANLYFNKVIKHHGISKIHYIGPRKKKL